MNGMWFSHFHVVSKFICLWSRGASPPNWFILHQSERTTLKAVNFMLWLLNNRIWLNSHSHDKIIRRFLGINKIVDFHKKSICVSKEFQCAKSAHPSKFWFWIDSKKIRIVLSLWRKFSFRHISRNHAINLLKFAAQQKGKGIKNNRKNDCRV